jgi:hypothetical protein
MAAVRSLVDRIGRRGCFLAFLVVLDLAYGLSLAKPVTAARQSPTVKYIAHIFPLWVWAIIWLAVGVACAVGMFVRRDAFAFASAMALTVGWGAIFGAGWLLAGLERGWLTTVIWWSFAAVIALIASWPEPPRRVP